MNHSLGMGTMTPPLVEHRNTHDRMLSMNSSSAASEAAVEHQQQQLGGGDAASAAYKFDASTSTTEAQKSSSGCSGSCSNDCNHCKLYVGRLNLSTTSEKLSQYFSAFGIVKEAIVLRNRKNRVSRGFGFVTYSNHEAAEKVLKMPFHAVDNTVIEVKSAVPKYGPRLTNRVFLGGISELTSEEVKAYFAQYGKIESTDIVSNHLTNRSRGFGFINFQSEAVVDLVCQIHIHTIKNSKVECRKAQPHWMTNTSYGKTYPAYQGSTGIRYTPYPRTTLSVPQPPMSNPSAAPTLQTIAASSSYHYQGYHDTNVDMSSFQAQQTSLQENSMLTGVSLNRMAAWESADSTSSLAAMEALNTRSTSYGKMHPAYQGSTGIRYAPYPGTALLDPQPPMSTSQFTSAAPTLQTIASSSSYYYQSYHDTNANISSFQALQTGCLQENSMLTRVSPNRMAAWESADSTSSLAATEALDTRSTSYGKMYPTYQGSTGIRYSPYLGTALPAFPALSDSQPLMTTPMSSSPGVDKSSMYGSYK